MTPHNVVHSRRKRIAAFAVAACVLAAIGRAEAQSVRELAPRDDVREAAREILEAPEFRHFRRLEGSGSSYGGDSSGDRSGGPQREPRGGEAGRRQPETKRSTSDATPEANERPWADGWRGGAEGGRDNVDPDRAAQQRPENGAAEGAESRGTPPPANGNGGTNARGWRTDGTSSGEPVRGGDGDGGTRRGASGDGSSGGDGSSDARGSGSSGSGGSAQGPPPIRSRSQPFGDGWRGGSGSREQFARDFRSSSGSGGTRGEGRAGRDGGRSGTRSAPRSSADSSASQGRSPPPSSPSSAPVSSAAGGLNNVLGTLLHVLAWIFLAGVCLLIAYVIFRAIRDYERPQKLALAAAGSGEGSALLEPEAAPGETPADVFVARARELAAAGQYRDAVAHLLLGAMSRLEQAGLVQYRRGLTLRDYLRASRGRKPWFSGFKSLLRVYEPLGFGRRPAGPEHFERSLTDYDAHFAGSPGPASLALRQH